MRYRSDSPSQLLQTNNQRKRRGIDSKSVDRNDINQALAVIAPASECTDEGPTLIPTELPQFKANFIEN